MLNEDLKAPGDSEQQEGEGGWAGASWPKETLYWLMKEIQSSTKKRHRRLSAGQKQWGREVLGYNLLQILSTNYRGQTQVTLSSSSMSGAPLKFLQEQIMQAWIRLLAETGVEKYAAVGGIIYTHNQTHHSLLWLCPTIRITYCLVEKLLIRVAINSVHRYFEHVEGDIYTF